MLGRLDAMTPMLVIDAGFVEINLRISAAPVVLLNSTLCLLCLNVSGEFTACWSLVSYLACSYWL